MIDVDLEAHDLLATRKEMERTVAELHGTPVLNAFRDATLYVTRDAKVNAPVDSGRLRASITPEVKLEGKDVIGIVGSNVTYAPVVELGAEPFFPRVEALEVWASRHGMDAFVVARAIASRGLRAVRFLQNALEANTERIMRRIEQGVDEATREK